MYIIHIQGEIGMFCTKCGAKNPEDATFCYKCGNEIKTVKQEKETERPKSFNDDVQNKTSLLKNKKWLYGIIAVAVLLGFGGYKWYNRNAFAKAVDGHVYEVTIKSVDKKKGTTTVSKEYSSYVIHKNKLYEFTVLDEKGKEVSILNKAMSLSDIYNINSNKYNKYGDIYRMDYDNDGDYNDIDDPEIFVTINKLDMSKIYDKKSKKWIKGFEATRSKKYKVTRNGYTSKSKHKNTVTTVTATKVD